MNDKNFCQLNIMSTFLLPAKINIDFYRSVPKIYKRLWSFLMILFEIMFWRLSLRGENLQKNCWAFDFFRLEKSSTLHFSTREKSSPHHFVHKNNICPIIFPPENSSSPSDAFSMDYLRHAECIWRGKNFLTENMTGQAGYFSSFRVVHGIE